MRAYQKNFLFGFLLLFSVKCFAVLSPSPAFSRELSKFARAVTQIKLTYVDKVADKDLMVSAMKGLLAGLDPHSAYLDAEDLRELQTRTTGEFVGLGIEITQDKHLIKIVSPIDDTPAKKAGLKAGDYILAIDGKPITEEMGVNDVVRALRGPKGTSVVLTIARKKDKRPKKITVKRAVIHIKSVKSKLLGNGFGYVRISQFQIQTAGLVKKAILSLQKKSKLKGLILDLRNNPGGVLEASGEVADLFLHSPKKLIRTKKIFYTKGRDKAFESSVEMTPGDILKGLPMIVVVNQGSASASEIVAGALQDHKRAIIVGQKSFGKGSVQAVFPLDASSALKLTTARYYTPLGHSIQATGIKPDILIGSSAPTKENLKEELDAFYLSVREKDLQGHLKNGNPGSKKAVAKKKNKRLALKDYQLYEALKLIQGLHIYYNEFGE